jgi:Domain of unknown function (DUF6456)
MQEIHQAPLQNTYGRQPGMKISEAPAFLVERRTLKPGKTRAPLKTMRKKARQGALRVDGDTGTPEMKMRQKVLIEARDRTSTGHITSVGARVEAQFPHDRYKIRRQLDPDNEWRNLMLWQGGERLRHDFEASGLSPKVCSSFVPRVTGGMQQWAADKQVDALQRYKKAMNSIGSETSGAAMRSCVFYVLIAGEHASDWARRNGKTPQVGIEILRMGLSDLAHYYGIAKSQTAKSATNSP